MTLKVTFDHLCCRNGGHDRVHLNTKLWHKVNRNQITRSSIVRQHLIQLQDTKLLGSCHFCVNRNGELVVLNVGALVAVHERLFLNMLLVFLIHISKSFNVVLSRMAVVAILFRASITSGLNVLTRNAIIIVVWQAKSSKFKSSQREVNAWQNKCGNKCNKTHLTDFPANVGVVHRHCQSCSKNCDACIVRLVLPSPGAL